MKLEPMLVTSGPLRPDNDRYAAVSCSSERCNNLEPSGRRANRWCAGGAARAKSHKPSTGAAAGDAIESSHRERAVSTQRESMRNTAPGWSQGSGSAGAGIQIDPKAPTTSEVVVSIWKIS